MNNNSTTSSIITESSLNFLLQFFSSLRYIPLEIYSLRFLFHILKLFLSAFCFERLINPCPYALESVHRYLAPFTIYSKYSLFYHTHSGYCLILLLASKLDITYLDLKYIYIFFPKTSLILAAWLLPPAP